jgi:proteasome lid subunit RPN8/RPN11
MAIVDMFRYVADVRSHSGEPLGQLPVDPDWEPAVQWAHFQAVRQRMLPPLMRCSSARVEPVWHSELSEPRVDGVRVAFDQADPHDERSSAFVIPPAYFRLAVEVGATVLVEEGKLQDGERFLYEVSAFPRPRPAADEHRPSDRDFTVEEIVRPLPLASASLDATLQGARRVNGPTWSDSDVPLFIPARVIAEAMGLARQAGEVESGGVLIGKLFRDATGDELFSVVTAFIPAPHARAETTRLTFTADTWAAVRAAVELRGQDEILLGWAHSHPFWCKSCPEERRRDCPLLRPFFSAHDVALHRAVFSGPFHIALLISDLGEDDLACDVFGWRYGMVAHRGYYLTDAATGEGDELRDAAHPRAQASEPSEPVCGAIEAGAACDAERCSRTDQTE